MFWLPSIWKSLPTTIWQSKKLTASVIEKPKELSKTLEQLAYSSENRGLKDTEIFDKYADLQMPIHRGELNYITNSLTLKWKTITTAKDYGIEKLLKCEIPLKWCRVTQLTMTNQNFIITKGASIYNYNKVTGLMTFLGNNLWIHSYTDSNTGYKLTLTWVDKLITINSRWVTFEKV